MRNPCVLARRLLFGWYVLLIPRSPLKPRNTRKIIILRSDSLGCQGCRGPLLGHKYVDGHNIAWRSLLSQLFSVRQYQPPQRPVAWLERIDEPPRARDEGS